MGDSKAKFLRVFTAELEDLLEDIGLAERRHAERLARREITDYVFMENDALFRIEGESIRRILNSIDQIDLSLYTTVDELCAALDASIKAAVRDREQPEAICAFVGKKLEKVRKYVASGDDPGSI